MPQYPPEATGYYLKRGHFVDQCCAIAVKGQSLDTRTYEVGCHSRQKPLSADGKTEQWISYVDRFREWMCLHRIEFISAQERVDNLIDGYVGTLDLLLEVDGALTLIDLKCGSLPPYTPLQTALYNIGIGMKAKKRLGLLLTPDKCEEFWFNNFGDYNEAKVLARAYHIMEKYRK